MAIQGVKDETPNERIAELLLELRGNVTDVAKVLKLDRRTVSRRIAEDVELQEAKKTARESLKDHAEAKLFELIEAGHWPAIRFYLATQGRDRGYIETLPAALNQVSLETLRRFLSEFGIDASDLEIVEQITEIDNAMKAGTMLG